MLKRLFFLFIFLLLISIKAQEVKTEYLTTELISEVKNIKPGQSFWVAVRFSIIPEWHIYWRNAGDAGLTTKLIWDLPEGFTAEEINWPTPKKIILEGLVNFGYEDEVFLPVKINVSENVKSDQNIKLKVKAEWLVCKVECYPGEADLELSLPISNDNPVTETNWVEAFAKTRAGLSLMSSDWKFNAIKNDSTVILYMTPPANYNDFLSSIEFFPYENGFYNLLENPRLNKENNYYKLEVKQADFLVGKLNKFSGILINENGWRGEGSEKSLEINISFDEDLSINLEDESNSILLAIIFAFLGGIILNLMPCVLPVLSIKILSFVNYAGEEKKKILKSGLLFGLGVLISFWILAGLLIILRAGGEQLGWGFQLQSPIFLISLSVFLFLFGLSLFGVFEIGNSFSSIEGKVKTKNSYTDSFLSGVIATIVATPCTAPFMGSALGYALSQSAFVNILIFSSVGLGMAFPYILLSAFPQWLKFIPKPGQWMESLKQFMGFLLVATVIWLAWVLSIQEGSDAVIILLIALLLISIGAWIYGRWGVLYQKKSKRYFAKIAFLAFLILGLYFAFDNINSDNVTNPAQLSVAESEWLAYSDELVKEFESNNRSYFIDFTAAWCLSCQVNKKVALNTSSVLEKFKEYNIKLIKADWTSRDSKITKALEKYGRNSVPVYVLYNAKTKKYELLPEILTSNIVIDNIENNFSK